jgi:hypothetical protein
LIERWSLFDLWLSSVIVRFGALPLGARMS